MNGVVLDSGVPSDADADGYTSVLDGGDDCDDGDALVHPGTRELCNLADDNCDGTADEGCPRTLDDSPSGDGLAWTCSSVPATSASTMLLVLAAISVARRGWHRRQTGGA